jgi:hypothetical protein
VLGAVIEQVEPLHDRAVVGLEEDLLAPCASLTADMSGIVAAVRLEICGATYLSLNSFVNGMPGTLI